MQSQTLQRVCLVRTARAEAAWLAGDRERALQETSEIYDLAVSKQHPWFAGELAFWRWRAEAEVEMPGWMARPYALHIAGDWLSAAEAWEQLGCPYEQARALAEGDIETQIAALEIFERLGVPMQRLRQSWGPHVTLSRKALHPQKPFGPTPARSRSWPSLKVTAMPGYLPAFISPRQIDHHISILR
jgi:hypothetical protein